MLKNYHLSPEKQWRIKKVPGQTHLNLQEISKETGCWL
jgi:hypothetical protein